MTKPTIGSAGPVPAAKDVRYLECSAEPGMFRDEFLVFIDGLDPDHINESVRVQVLVDSDLVKLRGKEPKRGQPVAGLLRVSVAKVLSNGVAIVVLPQPGIPVGESVLVREGALVEQ